MRKSNLTYDLEIMLFELVKRDNIIPLSKSNKNYPEYKYVCSRENMGCGSCLYRGLCSLYFKGNYAIFTEHQIQKVKDVYPEHFI